METFGRKRFVTIKKDTLAETGKALYLVKGTVYTHTHYFLLKSYSLLLKFTKW